MRCALDELAMRRVYDRSSERNGGVDGVGGTGENRCVAVEEMNPEAALLAALAELRVHDASPVIEPGMPMFVVYDGPEITPLLRHDEAGAAANRISLSEHTGTHVDAPFHFDRTGLTIDLVAGDALLLRPYKKFDLSPLDPAPGELVGRPALEAAAERAGFRLAPGDVAIIEMGWDRHWPRLGGDNTHSFWGQNMPGLNEDACRYIAQAGVVAVASDTAACDNAVLTGEIGAGHGHGHWFLPRGILIVEGLRGLAEVAPSGLIVALPLKIKGGTGSPLRVLLLHRGE
jgi:kynurenine formamidase